MSLTKQTKDYFIRLVLGNNVVPKGLSELNHYFRLYGPINFHFEQQEDGTFIAVSENFRYGSIITSAKDQEELDEKVRDAIMTSFEVPSSYMKEAGVHRVGEKGYAFA